MTQKEALEVLKSGRSVFLTGQAGSGKTHVLNEYIKFLRKKKRPVGITASTGIAATHLDGMTIHAWTGMGILDELTKEELQKILHKGRLRTRIRNTQVLIIDEISMLSSRHLDIAEEIVRTIHEAWEPFGGMQVVLCGDFFQLPPVNKRGAEQTGQFAYYSRAWKELNPNVCYLTEQYRHKDQNYLKVLSAIRANTAGEQTLDILKQRFRNESNERTKLYTHNVDVDRINEGELAKLEDEEVTFRMHSSGPIALVEVLHKSCLAPEVLGLKERALVMFLRNNFDEGYVNGTLGIVDGFNKEGYPVVRTQQGKSIEVLPEEWSIENEEGKVLASIEQLPLRLAWAITVHKSQGMTLDAAEMDLSKCFELGMGYVALSRVRTLEGVYLRGINDIALKVSQEAVEMDKEFQRRSAETAKEFYKMLKGQIEEDQERSQRSSVGKAKAYSVEEIRRTHANAYQKWTPEEEVKLRECFASGKTVTEVAKILGREKGGVKSRLRKLGLA